MMPAHYCRGRDRRSRQSRVPSWRCGARARRRRLCPRRHPCTLVPPPRQSQCSSRIRTRAASPQHPDRTERAASVEDPSEPRGWRRQPESLPALGESGGDGRWSWVWEGDARREEAGRAGGGAGAESDAFVGASGGVVSRDAAAAAALCWAWLKASGRSAN